MIAKKIIKLPLPFPEFKKLSNQQRGEKYKMSVIVNFSTKRKQRRFILNKPDLI